MKSRSRFRRPYECDELDCADDFICMTDSLTNQSERDSVDIRKIIERYRRDGVIPDNALTPEEASFADVSEIHDYAEMMRRVEAGRAYFSQLPAEIREAYENDPILYMDAIREVQEALLESDPDDIPTPIVDPRDYQKKPEKPDKAPQTASSTGSPADPVDTSDESA